MKSDRTLTNFDGGTAYSQDSLEHMLEVEISDKTTIAIKEDRMEAAQLPVSLLEGKKEL